MWENVKTICFRSLTIGWAYVLGLFGLVMGQIDNLGILLGDPTLSQQVGQLLHADPKALATFSLLTSAVTIITRARSLLKKPS